jgi:periplasmic protein TonB
VLVALAFLLPYTWYALQQRQASRVPVSQERVVTLNQLSAPPPIEQPLIPPQVEPLPQASVRHLPPVVKKDEEVPDEMEMPTVQELSEAQPSPVTAPGDSFVYLPPPAVEPEPEPEPAPKPAPAPKVFQVVEEMPEFPGGEQAMYAFLRKHMVYPTVARENGISGRVYVKFTVQPDGRVSDVYVARGIGGGCDEEAVRVVRMMPNWKPGIQSGRAVAVEYTLPLNFVFQE